MQILASQSMKEKTPSLEELETSLRDGLSKYKQETSEQTPSDQIPNSGDEEPITKFLMAHKKGFFCHWEPDPARSVG